MDILSAMLVLTKPEVNSLFLFPQAPTSSQAVPCASDPPPLSASTEDAGRMPREPPRGFVWVLLLVGEELAGVL